ncbi:ATP-binding protein [Nocardia farcinica]|uniref:ATP-binding protein n=1 Tax=Nocardia farcinica TaxID=37329 RepID=UPI00245854AB|nr:AAA family ATPase [Nocardia farcinica]
MLTELEDGGPIIRPARWWLEHLDDTEPGWNSPESLATERAEADDFARRWKANMDGIQDRDDTMYATVTSIYDQRALVEAKDAAKHRKAVAGELERLRAQDEARRLFAAEKAGPADPFDAGSLAELLARPPEAPYRVDGLVPADGGLLITAQRKTGKTTLVLNLARCLITGEHFLGGFPVQKVTGRVAVLNFEVSGQQFARWAHDVGVPADRLFVVNLRGRRNPFGNDADRAQLAALLRAQNAESVIVDPFGRAYSGTSQNDAGEVGAWLAQLDYFARTEVGASDIVLTAHAGWNGERTRGSSALEDWMDGGITLTQNDDGVRFIRAMGRDVELEEDQLSFDRDTRLLRVTGAGSRKTARKAMKATGLVSYVVEAVRAAPGCNAGELAAAVRKLAGDSVGHQDHDVNGAADLAMKDGQIRIEGGGRGKAKRHYPLELKTIDAEAAAG